MIFKDKLNELEEPLSKDFKKLFDDILKNQNHSGDLLLLYENCSYKSDYPDKSFEPLQVGTYIMGPGKEGHSEFAHYDFIHQYRTQYIWGDSLVNYLKLHVYTTERQKEIDQLVFEESLTVQLEMLIYLKIWEMDMFIKKLYQLIRLSKGEAYDWHFKINESNRDEDGTGTRQNIIRKLIRDRIKKDYPEIYKAIKASYLTQIRNSIAHSKYSFLGRNIHPNNFIEKDPASQLKCVTFDEWINMFHYTLLLFNNLIEIMNKAQKHYSEAATKNENLIDIKIYRKIPQEEVRDAQLEYRANWNDWIPKT